MSVNAEIIRPTNEAPSPVGNIAVIEDVTKDDYVKISTGIKMMSKCRSVKQRKQIKTSRDQN